MIQMRSDEAFEVVKEACNYAELAHYAYSFELQKAKRLHKALEILEKVLKIYKGKYEYLASDRQTD